VFQYIVRKVVCFGFQAACCSKVVFEYRYYWLSIKYVTYVLRTTWPTHLPNASLLTSGGGFLYLPPSPATFFSFSQSLHLSLLYDFTSPTPSRLLISTYFSCNSLRVWWVVRQNYLWQPDKVWILPYLSMSDKFLAYIDVRISLPDKLLFVSLRWFSPALSSIWPYLESKCLTRSVSFVSDFHLNFDKSVTYLSIF
jgi:hypothetical protein